ncbi:DUF6924 domain-containing protein [Streptomyces sp. enrichment culture]|uniref:DUF6924 domain-containing protein n=1 Tax=Streptomyces sp. enrichment culture TaxID=1795815 RepID=UPI003F55214C
MKGEDGAHEVDFGDDRAWDAVRAALDAAGEYPHATYVSEPRFADVEVQALLDEEAAMDLSDEPGRTFRLPAWWVY